MITSGSTNGGPGPRAQLYAVNPDAAHVAALDVTPTRILAAVADITGRTVGEYELRTPRRPGPDAVSHVATGARGGRHLGRPARRPACSTSRSARPAPSTRAPGGCATPATCPAGTTRTCSSGSPTQVGVPSTSTTTSTSPPSPSCAAGRRPRRRRLRAAVGRRGPRRRDRDRRPAPRRRDRRRRRGRLPAAARHAAGPRRTPRQRRRVPGAGRRPAGARPGPLARAARRHPGGRRHRGARPRPAPATSCSPTLAHRFALGHRGHGRRRRPGPRRPLRRGADRGRPAPARPDRRRARLARRRPATPRAGRRPGAARSSPAPCRPLSTRLGTRSSTPSDNSPQPGSARPVTRRAP